MASQRPQRPDGGETPPALVTARMLTPGPTVRFFSAFFLALLVCAASVAAFNYAMDPRAEFGTGAVQPLVENQVAKRVAFFNDLEQPPETVVLGNSQAIRLGDEALGTVSDGPVLNFALGGGSLRDLPILYRYVSEASDPPEQLIVSVSPRQVQPDRGLNPNIRQAGATAGYVDGTPREPLVFRLAPTLTSGYVEDSARAAWYAIDEPPQPKRWYEDDGTRHLRDVHRAVANGTFDAEGRIEEHLGHTSEEMEAYVEPAEDHLAALDTLVAEARANGTTVRIFAPPLHPRLAANVSDTSYPAHQEALMEHVSSLCGDGVHVHDLSDLETLEPYGGTREGFFDPIHTFGPNSDAIAAALADPATDRCSEDSEARPPAR